MDTTIYSGTSTSISFNRAIAERLDRLPVSRETLRIMLLAGIAWLVESYDIGIIGNVLPSLTKQFSLNAFTVGLLAIASTLGIVVAVIPSGMIADRIGRKKMLVVGTAWYAAFSFLCGLATTPAMLIALRFISGLGMGAIFPIPYAMAAEYMPRHFRGAMTSILDSFLSLGYFIAPLAAFALIPQVSGDMGWRYLFFLGGLPLLYVPVLMRWMPESARWLQATGHEREADSIVQRIERRIEQRTGRPLPQPQIEASERVVSEKSSVRAVFSKGYLKRTIMMWISFSCILFMFYAIQTYTPTVLLKEGNTLGTSFLLTSIIVLASIPGKYAAAYALERFGRKFTLIWFAAIAAISAVIFGLVHDPVLAVAFGVIMSFFGIGVDPAIKIYGAEQYPTRMRETGIGFFEGVGRFFGGALAPFIMSFILTYSGIAGSYVFVAILAVGGLAAVALLGSETRGQAIEQVSEIQERAA
ncbi:MAG TPA: MFS transporter [Ktedonobacteraceae bacterium]|jgi:putative MFS transporter|nr:MFS transporter [Ktedonobacteraceae bacterium]